MATQFSLAYLTIPGIDPVEQIKIARDAGYDCVSLRTIPMGLCDEPQVCLENNPQLFTRSADAAGLPDEAAGYRAGSDP